MADNRGGKWPGRLGAGDVGELIETFLADGKKGSTAAAYRKHLRAFAKFCECGVDQAVGDFLSGGEGRAYSLAVRWQAWMRDNGVAATTSNPRISALRSLVSTARRLRIVRWHLEVRLLEVRPYRDTRGPGVEVLREMLRAAECRGDAIGARDVAILQLLGVMALRRGEVASLDVEHVELGRRPGVWVLGKGRQERQWIGLPVQTRDAIRRWLLWRGGQAGPLFVTMSRARQRGERLTTGGIWWIVRHWGEVVGERVKPHGLRHTGITMAAAMSGSAFDLMVYSRHRKPEVAQVYIDQVSEQAEQLAADVAATVLGS